MKLFLGVILVCCFGVLGISNQNFHYEKRERISALGKRVPDFRLLNRKAYEYPQSLPSSTIDSLSARQPFPSLYQGFKAKDDVRVFRKTFTYPATPVGHRIICEDLLDCTITYISIETKKSIPIILRGGAGYRHFTVVVRAKPWDPLEGQIRVYCRPVKEDKL